MNQSYSSFSIVLEHHQSFSVSGVQRLTGLVRFADLLELFDFIAGDPEKEKSGEEAAFGPNPRLAHTGRITNEIAKTLHEARDQFPVRNKGILLGASEFSRDGKRLWRLRINSGGHEGLADGGHTLLTVGIHLLTQAIADRRARENPEESEEERMARAEKAAKKVKNWPTFARLWQGHREELGRLAEAAKGASSVENPFAAQMPVEMLLPETPGDKRSVATFQNSLSGVARSRNVNAQVRAPALMNQEGLYEPMKQRLPEFIRDNVEWATGDGNPLKVDEVTAIAFIAFNRLHEAGLTKVSTKPSDIYNSKATVLRRYGDLIRASSKPSSRSPYPRLESAAVESALDLLPDLLGLHDLLVEGLPEAYNAAGGRFGTLLNREKEKRESQAKKGRQPAKYTEGMLIAHDTPRGFIMPILNGFAELMDIRDGRVVWGVRRPDAFLERHFVDIARTFKDKVVKSQPGQDPSKIGKNGISYDQMRLRFKELRLLDGS